MNMKILFQLILIFIFTASYSNEKADSSKTKLRAGATISLNSNGISSIPAFTLDKPAIIATISLVKNRFSYEPTLAYGFDLRPWTIDNWLRYKFVDRPHFEFRAGLNISAFSSEFNLAEEGEILQSQRYFTPEVALTYKFSPGNSLMLNYLNDNGQEKGTIDGHFLNLQADRSGIRVGKRTLLSATIQLFYVDYDGNNDGLYISPKISSSLRNIPFAIFFQAIQPITSNISPYPEFKWNLGISYAL